MFWENHNSQLLSTGMGDVSGLELPEAALYFGM